jgi:hypothetical protein
MANCAMVLVAREAVLVGARRRFDVPRANRNWGHRGFGVSVEAQAVTTLANHKSRDAWTDELAS